MSDPYADLAAQDAALQERIADAMEARCIEPAQVAIRRAYLGDLSLPDDAFAVEPSPVSLARAQTAFAGEDGLSFQAGDARSTGLDDASVSHTPCSATSPDRRPWWPRHSAFSGPAASLRSVL